MTENPQRRFAAIDIGTNSVLLSIASASSDGDVVVIEEHATVTRLGQGVDKTRRLHPDAEERTLHCLSQYRTFIDRAQVSSACAVGTSALRDADGGAEFLKKSEKILGFCPEIISGRREAELTFGGALSGLGHQGRAFVFDIGGGSTEIVVGTPPTSDAQSRPTIEQAVSLDLGSVRLTERFRPSDPATPEELLAIRSQIRAALSTCGITQAEPFTVVGVAGTVTTLAAIVAQMQVYDPRAIHGARLSRSSLDTLVLMLSASRQAQRLNMPGLSPGRADVILSGALLCQEITRFSAATEILVSDRGVRFGLLSELAQAAHENG